MAELTEAERRVLRAIRDNTECSTTDAIIDRLVARHLIDYTKIIRLSGSTLTMRETVELLPAGRAALKE